MAFPSLIAGSVPQILAGDKEMKPILQCIGAKHMQQAGAPSTSAERYRLALSDGTHWCSAMLATQLNELVRTGELGNGSYIKLQDYLCNRVQHRQVIIVLGLDILTVGPKVGDPQPYEPPTGALENVPPAPFQPPKQAAPAGYQGPPQAQTYGGGAAPTNSYYGAPMQQGGYGGPQAPPGGQGRHPVGGGYGGNAMVAGGYGGNAMVAGGYGGNAMVAGGYGQAPAYRANNTPIARNEAAPKVVPIASLNAYQNRWTIRARVTQRSDIRRYSNARGEGKFFTVDLLDAHGGEIRAIAFNEVADKFEDVLKMGAIVMISKASLKPKKPGSTYNQTRHDHEITLEKQTMIEVCPDEDAGPTIPQMQYHFRRIEEIESTVATTMMDVIGIVESVDAWQTITRKDGQETIKRAVGIKDDSSRSVEVTLWGDYATNPGEQLEQMAKQGEKPILAVKSARVGDFNGKTLSTVGSSLIMVNPDIPEAGRLRHWYDQAGGADMVATKLSDQRGSGSGRVDRRCTVSAIKDEGLGQNGQAAFVQINAVVTMIKQENMFYPACSLNYNGRPCNKKLSDQGGTWWCERCQQNTDPEWRYILSITADDHTSSSWFTAFQEAGQQIMGATATELKELEQADLPAFESRVHATHFKPLLLKVKIAEDTYNDETRIKTSIMRAEPLDYTKESRILLDYISKIKCGEAVMAPLPAPGGGYATGGYSMGNQGAPQYSTGGGAYGFKQQTPPKYGGEPAGFGGGGHGGYGGGNQGRAYSSGFGPGGF